MLSIIFAKYIIQILFGQEYLPALQLARVMFLAAIFVALSMICRNVLIGIGRVRSLLTIDIIWAGMFLSIILLSVPLLLEMGLGLAYLISYIVLSFIFLLFFNIYNLLHINRLYYTLHATYLVVVVFIILFLLGIDISYYIISAICASMFLLFYLTLTKEDFEMIKKIIQQVLSILNIKRVDNK